MLAQEISAAGWPVHLNVLAQATVRARLKAATTERLYAPGAKYAQNEVIRFEGRPVTVESVEASSNPKQGQFQILTLRLPNGKVRYVAAGIDGALAQDRKSMPISEQRIQAILDGEDGPAIRATVQAALQRDQRFVWFQDAQGDYWCLTEMLPEVSSEDLARIWPLLCGRLQNGTLRPLTTEDLVKALWGQENDGSPAYLLKAFRLNVALLRNPQARWLGNGWVLAAEWEALRQRPVLVPPRQENVIEPPPGVTPDEKKEVVVKRRRKPAKPVKPATQPEEDLEAWRSNRRLNAAIVLRAQHYYGNWLPLTEDLAAVFPPYASGSYQVTFYHRFRGEEVSFPAWVDQEQSRILGSPEMYQAFYENGIYPGARLIISHRGGPWDYDIRTVPVDHPRRLLVRRVRLSDIGQLEYEETEEPIRYEVDGDVFIADARWEDLPALFQQAEEAGAGIFQLMWEKCVEWWEASGGQPLYVDAQALFRAIHYDDRGRLTTKATIAWELWQREAFEPLGSGKYLFRPEKLDRRRSVELRGRIYTPPVVPPVPQGQKAPTPAESEGSPNVQTPPSPPPAQPEQPEQEGEPTLWDRVAQLAGQDLHALDQGHLFRILAVADQWVEIWVSSSDQRRTIHRREIESAWRHLAAQQNLSRIEIHKRYSEFNPAYVAAILTALPGVTYQTDPIRLFYQRAETQEATTSFPPVLEPPAEEKEPSEQPEVTPTQTAISSIPPTPIEEYQLSPALPSEPALERTTSGQLVAAELVPPGPLFDGHSQPVESLSPQPPSEAPQPIGVEVIELEAQAPVAITEEPKERPLEVSGPPPPGPPPPSTPRQPMRPARGRHERPRPPVARGSKSLFSRHYLERRIHEHSEWTEDVSWPFVRLKTLYEGKKKLLPNLNEAATEDEFIRPVLEILGFAYIVQTPARSAGRVLRPDYALFGDEESKRKAYTYQQNEQAAFYARALAIADAKYWGRPLSETRADDNRDEFKNTNPSFQMVNYLIGTGVDWGILTNGAIWRLYYRQASSTATEFYEVNLVELLEAEDLERFKYFWLFFRREAFVKDAQGRNFLERVREGSTTYARDIGDRLKTLVFGEVFPFLSGGFVAFTAARGEDATSEAARQRIYEATLSLLYKLLFLLYAEARNLLPMDNAGYREQSLTRMAQEIGERLERRQPLGQTSTAFYDHLLNLFHLVDRGDRGLGVPRYNGGLFSRSAPINRFLQDHKLVDGVLAPALDRLARVDGEFVDYSFIGVRHLGAIYEGLLEYKLIVDDAATGDVHLETDKGERKATGSYYTPDYVVKYIVQHTLEPILAERQERFADLMGQIAEVRNTNCRAKDRV